MSIKPQRLSKVARDFNLGLSTIVEFLSEKGFEVEAKPNTKLLPEMMEVLVSEFQPDKSLKEKSAKISVQPPKRETVSIEPVVEVKKEEKKEEKKEVVIEKKIEEKKEDEVFKGEEGAAKLDGLKVVGKIDLPTKTNKKASAAKPAEKKAAEKKVDEAKVVKPVDEPVVKKEAVKIEPVAEKQPVKEEKKEVEKVIEKPVKKEEELFRTETSKLDGPKIMGKIVLPVTKKPIASSDSNDSRKRKRKRIRKEPVENAGTNTNTGTARPKGKFAPKKATPKAELTDEDVQ